MGNSVVQKTKMKDEMRAYIYKQHDITGRYPTVANMVEALKMSNRTVQKYKKEILLEQQDDMKRIFKDGLIAHTHSLLKTLIENRILYTKIRDDTFASSNERMNAAKLLEETNASIVALMRDGPDYLSISNQNELYNNTQQEQVYGQADTSQQGTEAKPATS